jgi:predicted dehydrogenase
MNKSKIRIGFIGLNPDKQWASTAHIPALRTLVEEFEIVGVANSTYQSAKRSAEAFQIPLAFANAQALIQSNEIDLVVITVKVPHHYELVKAALEAGKHVYCEHPLGNGLEETKALAALAAQKNVVAVVGTQLVAAPELLYLQQLINEGYVGRVLSSTLNGSVNNWGDNVISHNYYINDKSFGATLFTVPFAHTLAGVIKVLGGFGKFKAEMYNNFTSVKVTDTDEIKSKTTEDQILVIGAFKSGAAFSAHYRGGINATSLVWEINGTEGDIQVTGSSGHAQLLGLNILGKKSGEKELRNLTPPIEMYQGLPDDPLVRNVAAIYRLAAGDIRKNTHNAPTFEDAAALHQVLSSIEQSASI